MQKPLKCTHKNCKALQTADGEFCDKHYPKTQYDRVIDALNLIDEQAEHSGASYAEEVARGKAYKLVADFIDLKAKR